LNFLAIDSTGHFSSAGFFEMVNKRLLLKEAMFNFSDGSSTKAINELISQIIRTNQIEKLEFIAISLGPGSFTKIRASLSFAKGLSFGLNAPVIGVNGFHKLFEVGKSLNKKNIGLLLACDTFRKSAFVSLQNISKNRNFINEIETLSINDIVNMKNIHNYSCITVLGDLASQTNKLLKINRFNICEEIETYAYTEIGLTSLINIALEIKTKNESFNQNPIYISAPITNKRKNKN